MRTFLLFAVILTLVVGSVFAAVPQTMNYQGRLTDPGGTPVANASYSVIFTIYDDPTAGVSVWGDTLNVTTTNGLFSVLLGSVNPIKDTVFNGTTRYLGIAVDGDPELTPRTAMVSVPYAFRVSTVDGASGGHISGKVSIGLYTTNTGGSAFAAGELNTAMGGYSTISGGLESTAFGEFSAISGGHYNTANGENSAVGGGELNLASELYSTVSGGLSNTASGIESTVSGGENNTASGHGSTISGGVVNTAIELNSTVSGGLGNTASGSNSTVSGGWDNTASEASSTVSGGNANSASGIVSTVSGGSSNTASGYMSTVSGGVANTADGRFSFAAGRKATAWHDGAFVWADSTNSFFESTGPNQFLISATGGVGIGTSTPATQLHVQSNNATSYGGVSGFNEVIAGFKNSNSTNHSALSIDASTGQDPVLYFSEDGSAVWGIRNDASADNKFQIRTQVGGSNTARLTILSTGEIGIGTSSPNYKLDVRGTIGNNATLHHSDRRWKSGIATLTNSLDKVQKLRGVSFDWKKDEFADMNFPEGKQIGLIAQEVEQVLPEVVNTGKDGFKSVDYSKMVALLIEANKEQQKQIDELKELVYKLANQSKENSSTYGMK